jgi:flavin-dependent dehydrogenase
VRRTPALIVGGGPSGATLALRLAQAGLPHVLLERTRETGDAICGGFLSWRTLAMLERLGVSGTALNLVETTHVRLFARHRMVETRLPFPARAVSRRTLDTLLLAAARRAGAAIERGAGARTITDGVVSLDDGATITGDALFLASGKHDIRGLARPATARGSDPTIGLRVRLGPAASLDRLVGQAIELHLVDRGYAGMVRQEDGAINLCMAVRRSRLSEAGDPERLLAALAEEVPALGERLAHRVGGSTVDAIANVPYGWRETQGEPALFRLGDQAGVIPSLAGEGMAIAIASAMTAADHYVRGGAGAALPFQQAFARRLHRPVTVAAAAWHLAERPLPANVALRVAAQAPGMIALLARLTRIDRQS